MRVKARGAPCFVKLGGFFFSQNCDHDRDWKRTAPLSMLKVPFFSISCFLFLRFTFCLPTAGKTKCVAVPFHQLNSEMKHVWNRMFYHFIPVCETTTSLNLIFFFPPRCSYCVAHEASLLTGTEGTSWSASQHKSFVFVFHVIFLSGVAAHQAEIMRPCSVISDTTL